MWVLIAARGAQGAGAGGIAVAVISVVADLVPARRRGRLQGLYSSTFALAALVGPFVGGFLVGGPGWRWAFAVSLPPAALCLTMVQRRLPANRVAQEGRLDWSSSTLLVAALCSGILAFTGIERGGTWTNPLSVAEVILALGLGLGFALRQRRADEAVIPPQLFVNPVFALATGLAFVTGLLMFGALAFLPPYLQIAGGHSPTRAGLMLTPILAGALVCSTVTGRLVSRWGRYKAFPVAGMSCLCLGLALLWRLGPTTPYPAIAGPLVLIGSGVGLSTPVLFLAAQNAVPARDVGAASATITLFRAFGGAIGAAAFGALLVNRLGSSLHALLPGWTGSVNTIVGSPAEVAGYPAETRQAVRDAFGASTATLIHIALPLAAAAVVASLFLREQELDGGDAAVGTGRTEPKEEGSPA